MTRGNGRIDRNLRAGSLHAVAQSVLPEKSRDRRPVVAMRDISKRFGPVLANDRISLDLWPGEIHAVLGENGAGKTTLMNILAGMYQPDSGSIEIGGEPVHIDSPADGLRRGIGTVYQHFTLVPNLSMKPRNAPNPR